MWVIPTWLFLRVLYWKRYTRWINGLGTRLLQPRLRPLHEISRCSSLASASAAVPRLRLLQLLLPDCVSFNCCSPIASACSPSCSSTCPMFSNILRGVWGSVNWSTKAARHYSLVPPHKHPISVTHTHVKNFNILHAPITFIPTYTVVSLPTADCATHKP